MVTSQSASRRRRHHHSLAPHRFLPTIDMPQPKQDLPLDSRPILHTPTHSRMPSSGDNLHDRTESPSVPSRPHTRKRRQRQNTRQSLEVSTDESTHRRDIRSLLERTGTAHRPVSHRHRPLGECRSNRAWCKHRSHPHLARVRNAVCGRGWLHRSRSQCTNRNGNDDRDSHWLPISGYALLLASDSGPAPSRRHRFLALASIACLVALAGLVYTLRPASLWLAGLTVLICTVGLTLLCHRYERYRLEQALESTNHQANTDPRSNTVPTPPMTPRQLRIHDSHAHRY